MSGAAGPGEGAGPGARAGPRQGAGGGRGGQGQKVHRVHRRRHHAAQEYQARAPQTVS